MFIPLLRTGTSGSNAVPLVLPSSTPSILRSTIMDVLYADRRHAPVSEGIPKRHQNTKKQKVVRSNNRSSPISGISDDGSSSLKSAHQTTIIWADEKEVIVPMLAAAFLALYLGDQLHPQDRRQ